MEQWYRNCVACGVHIQVAEFCLWVLSWEQYFKLCLFACVSMHLCVDKKKKMPEGSPRLEHMGRSQSCQGWSSAWHRSEVEEWHVSRSNVPLSKSKGGVVRDEEQFLRRFLLLLPGVITWSTWESCAGYNEMTSTLPPTKSCQMLNSTFPAGFFPSLQPWAGEWKAQAFQEPFHEPVPWENNSHPAGRGRLASLVISERCLRKPESFPFWQMPLILGQVFWEISIFLLTSSLQSVK